MSGLVQNVRYALRQLRRSPGFAAVAILSLGLGIGANTAIFTLINGLLLKSLPVREPQQLLAFGAEPVLGRAIEPADDAPGRDPVAAIRQRYWRQVLSADPSMIGLRRDWRALWH
jgi:hypothetical protein